MICEKILLNFSRKPEEPDYDEVQVRHITNDSLSTLLSGFGPDFLKDIVGKTILDFGCGSGQQVTDLSLKGANLVIGVDMREKVLKQGVDLAREKGVYEKVKFITNIKDEFNEFFDIIISQNSFEHYSNPSDVITLWKKLLNPNGKIYITFGPPWHAPYGAHTFFFTKLPWVNLLFKESTVMKVRSCFRTDGAKHYEDVEGGLNKMTVKRFEKIIAESDLNISYVNYRAVKKMKFLTRIPFFRELFVNHIDCILIKK